MDSGLKECFDKVLRLKAENEHLKDQLDELKRLIRKCNLEDRGDVTLTMIYLKGLVK